MILLTLTTSESVSRFTGYKPNNGLSGLEYLRTHEFVDDHSWMSWTGPRRRVVIQVKNQGQCGSCWGFSTTESPKSVWSIATDKLLPSCEQQLVECDTVDSTCDGVFMVNGFAFTEKNDSCTNASCSYTATKGTYKDSSWTVDVGSGTATRVYRH